MAIEAFEAVESSASKAEAARKLNIDPSTLNRRLKRYYADPDSIVYRNASENGVAFSDVKMAWIKNDEVSMLWKASENMSFEDMRDSLVEEMKTYAPLYEPHYYPKNETLDVSLLVVDAADVHIGKLSKTQETGFEYNIKIASKRVQDAMEGLIKKASSFNVERIIFVIGNDILHIDHPHRSTTSGTPQDTDGQWWEMFLEAKRVYIKAIETLTKLAPVDVVFCPSNHDYVSGWMLADTISSWFNNHPNVNFGINNQSISINHRKYVVYGQNLLGFTHGDGCKEKDIPSLMQYEAREMWGKTKFAYMYTHHTHHKHRKFNGDMLEKDHIGVTVLSTSRPQKPDSGVYIETVRSPSPADAWHHRNGYVNKSAIEAFIHHHENGQIARLTEFF